MRQNHITSEHEAFLEWIEQKVVITMSRGEMKQIKTMLEQWLAMQYDWVMNRIMLKDAVLRLMEIWFNKRPATWSKRVKITPDLMQAMVLKEVLDECLMADSSIDAGVVNKIALQIEQQL